MMSRLSGLLRRYPVVPSMLTYSILYPGANLVQQTFFRAAPTAEDKINWPEVGRFLVYGGLFHAPLVYNWLKLAVWIFPKSTLSHVLAKVALDQVCFAPVAITTFYMGLSILEGKTREEVIKEWRDKFINTWATGIFIWSFTSAFNYRVVAAAWRPVFTGLVGFVWFIVLAHLKSRPGGFKAPVFQLYEKYCN